MLTQQAAGRGEEKKTKRENLQVRPAPLSLSCLACLFVCLFPFFVLTFVVVYFFSCCCCCSSIKKRRERGCCSILSGPLQEATTTKRQDACISVLLPFVEAPAADQTQKTPSPPLTPYPIPFFSNTFFFRWGGGVCVVWCGKGGKSWNAEFLSKKNDIPGSLHNPEGGMCEEKIGKGERGVRVCVARARLRMGKRGWNVMYNSEVHFHLKNK